MMKKITVYGICLLLLLQGGVSSAGFRFSPNENKAHLIRWNDWDRSLFLRAAKEKKLVLLSISAVWCHWCHVMDETTYSDGRVREFINARFIPVRVDADLRPDIDSIYNQGGWPSTVILTPEGEVLKGGNYIPPGEFLALLTEASEEYRTDPEGIAERGGRYRRMQTPEAGHMTITPDRELLDGIVRIYERNFDGQYGGFGSDQKFPNPVALDFLLNRYAERKDDGLLRIITRTLDGMAGGGLRDRVDGGFFRYATRQDWSGPHYEKMLDVNAGLLRNYARAYAILGNEEYLSVARETASFVLRHLSDGKSGAFYGSRDADEAYYLKEDRTGLKGPSVDRTVYADSSSLMVSALVAAAPASSDGGYLAEAEKAAGFLLRHLFSGERGVAHFYRGGEAGLYGLLSDNALFGTAMLDLYGMTGERRYLDAARKTGSLIMRRFHDRDGRQFRYSLGDSLPVKVAPASLAEINRNLANYRTLMFLGRLLHIEPETEMKAVRDSVLEAFSARYQEFAPHAGAYGDALFWAVGTPLEITVIGFRGRAREFLAVVSGFPLPGRVVRVLTPARDAGKIRKLHYPLQEAVYVCSGKRCSPPLSDPAELREMLKRFLREEKVPEPSSLK